MAYQDGGIDTMLRDSFVKILPKFGDKSIEEQFAKLVAEQQDDTDRNLYYVALSRAREQLILPRWEVINKGCMLSYIEPLIASRNEKQKTAIFEELKVAPSSVERTCDFCQPCQKIVLLTEADRQAKRLKHTISPSLDNQTQPVEVPKIKKIRYRPALDLDGFAHIPANDLGVWVHRLYQVFFMRPEMLEKALAMRAGGLEGRVALQDVKDHLDAFMKQIEKLIGKGKSWKCELPALGQNELGQVVSGMIDLIAEGEMRTLVIDHKSNQFVSENNYWSQLAAYHFFWEGADLNLNWVRHGLLEHGVS